MHVERSDLLERPDFWACRYCHLMKTTAEDVKGVIEPFFGVTRAQLDSFWNTHLPEPGEDDSHPKPCFDFSFPEGFVLRAKREAGGSGYEYYLAHQDWPRETYLGHDNEHWALPLLRWEEVVQLDRCLAETATTKIHRRVGLLFYFPTVWLAHHEQNAAIATAISSAWCRLGIGNPLYRTRFAEWMMKTQQLDNVLWWIDSELGWVNDGRYSFRNPKTLMCKFDRIRFERVAAFFAVVEKHTAHASEPGAAN
jgi:hypothetical protein